MDIPKVARRQKKWDVEAVMSVKGSPSGKEVKLKIIAAPVGTEAVDRPQARPLSVMSFRVRHKDILQVGYTQGCKARAGATQQAHDENTNIESGMNR